MSNKTRFPYAEAIAVAERLRDRLAGACERIEIVGSLRRRRQEVGDIELLYISKFEIRNDPDNMFGTVDIMLADEMLEWLMSEGVLRKRLNSVGHETYGPSNKLMQDCASSIPVDLFAATPKSWWNLLVCRTGPAESNIRVAQAAQRKGWKWHPYGAGFTGPQEGGAHIVTSERDVFDFVGLPYREPERRF